MSLTTADSWGKYHCILYPSNTITEGRRRGNGLGNKKKTKAKWEKVPCHQKRRITITIKIEKKHKKEKKKTFFIYEINTLSKKNPDNIS